MRLHILGICGTFMAGLAALARELGHEVSGSDAQVYPPMSDFLRDTGIAITEGWDARALDVQPDMVVIGNALSRGNPLVEAVLDSEIPYTSGAEWVAEHVLRGRRVIAVAGTHGKTTTTSLIAWLLEATGHAPGYLIGGIPGNFSAPARLGSGKWFVIEADEYDTAFFDKRSKFVHYRPEVALLNNLEFDHADIFPDLDAIKVQFRHLLRTVPRSGAVLWNADEPALAEVIAGGCWSPQQTFGSQRADWTIASHASGYSLTAPDGVTHPLDSALRGRHNAFNAAAAVAAAFRTGVALNAALSALKSFKGVKRRLELLGTVAGISVFDDFAHHPTAIAATVAALRESAPDRRCITVLELRSNSMRSGAHRESLAGALKEADLVFVLAPETLTWDVEETFSPLDYRCRRFNRTDDLLAGLLEATRAGDQVLIMSNGGFEGLHGRLMSALAEQEQAGR
jgi:UDP-N-acetylmuramate: L-alanyl-gamma-D-glutamyl-meso-diaminopimelate ligase